MDAKEIKLTLKSVKENLNAKDFKSAIKQCKSVLKNDRNNYMALVFLGVALQETEHRDEAPKAFKKATEVKPDNNLAWLGIASYYEKFQNNLPNQELLNAYEKLIVLESESSKYQELFKKYENLAVTMQDYATAKRLYNEMPAMPKEKSSLLKLHLLTIFLACPDTDTETQQYVKLLLTEQVSVQPGLEKHMALCKKYLGLLYKEKNFYDVIVVGNKIKNNYPDDLVILEHICKAYIELNATSVNNSMDESSLKEVYSALLKLNPKSFLGHLCKGFHELQLMDPVSALDSLNQSIKIEPTYGLTWFILCKCQILLQRFTDLEFSAFQVLKLFKKDSGYEKYISLAEYWLIQSLSEQDTEEKWSEAVNLGLKYYGRETNCEREDILPFVLNALIKLNRLDECDKYFDMLRRSEKHIPSLLHLECLHLQKSGKLDECRTKLESLVEERPECSQFWLELGKVYYNEKNHVSCLQCLLKSAKLNQWCYLTFLYLGHCYKDFFNDFEKSRRCYQKAFQLNPGNSKIGESLSAIYSLLGKEDLNYQLLTLITTKTPKQKWGWFNLGIHYLSTHQYAEAVNTLRVASRLDPNDRVVWEVLADAYFYRGGYVSALKAYNKVLDLGSDSIYPRLQIAAVKHLTGEHDASILIYNEIIDKHPTYVPALKGHADVCVSLMKERFSQSLFGLAKDSCQDAITSLMTCLETRKDLICIWKLLGDASLLFANLPEKYCKLRVPSKMVTEKRIREGQNEVVLNRAEVLKLSLRFYYEALSLNVDSSSLWYDLAVCYNYMGIYGATPDQRKEMKELASSAAKKSLLLDDKKLDSWNLLGVISASPEINDFPLAQHCFIKYLEENDSNAVVWTNLGALYLCLNDLKLANQSFKEAQRSDHDYVQCWIGQAMIAQKTGHYDAMDLFRHSTQLGIHPEGGVGYANLVCKTLLETEDKTDKDYVYSIKNMNAIAVACDALTWYTDRITDNPCAFNMLGLLLERKKLHGPACKAFNEAASLLSRDLDVKDSDKLDKALLNYGRSLINLGRGEEAIEVFKRIRKANFVNQCGLARAYFSAKLYEEAYSSYATTLEWLAPDTGFKSHILVAMAAVVYMHQGYEDAKILLMQACQLKPPSVQGLFACCALGMLHSDLALSELSLKELSAYRDDPKYINHIAVFESYVYLFKGEKEKAIRALSRTIHRHPHQPSLWLSLSLLLLHLYPSYDSQSAANCAEVTINVGRSDMDVSKIMSLVSLSNLLSGKGLRSLRSSQKAVHMFPHEAENWVVLVASVLSKCLVEDSARELLWLKKTIAYVRRKLEASKAMTQWLSNNERKVTLMTEAVSSFS